MVTDTSNLHTLKWLSEASGIPLRTIYYHVKMGGIKTERIDGISVVAESALPDWIKIKINAKLNEKTQ